MLNRDNAIDSSTIDLNNPEDLHDLFIRLVDKQLDNLKDSIDSINNAFRGVCTLPNSSDMLSDADFWQMLFLQHAVFFAYFSSRHYLSTYNPINLSSLVKYSHINGEDIADTRFHYGLDYLLEKKHLIIIEKDGKPIVTQSNTLKSDNEKINIGEKRSQYVSAIKTILKSITNGEPNSIYAKITMDNLEKNYVCDLTSFELIQHLMGKKAILSPLLQIANHPDYHFTPKSFQEYYLSYHRLVSQIIPNRFNQCVFDKEFYANLNSGNKPLSQSKLSKITDMLTADTYSHYTLSDKTYLAMYIEDIFNFERIDCLFQNIMNTSLYYEYDEINTKLPELVCCVNLPPIPAANYLITALFDMLNYCPHEFRKGSNSYNQVLTKYLVLYKDIITLLSNYTLYEAGKGFYSDLYDYIKHNIKNTGDFFIRNAIYRLLRIYINSDTPKINRFLSGIELLTEKKLYPHFSANTDESPDIVNNVIDLLKDMKDYNKNMDYYTNFVQSFYSGDSPITSMNIQSQTYADLALLPFTYSPQKRSLWPSKRNLELYETIIRQTYDFKAHSHDTRKNSTADDQKQ